MPSKEETIISSYNYAIYHLKQPARSGYFHSKDMETEAPLENMTCLTLQSWKEKLRFELCGSEDGSPFQGPMCPLEHSPSSPWVWDTELR
jgi:hypothetical protein